MPPLREINDLLDYWASLSPPINDFTVENILSGLNLDDSLYEGVLDYLMRKDGFELIAQKTVLCPNNHKNLSFSLKEPIEQYFDCFCGEEDFEPDNFLLTFKFTENFRNELQKKKQLKPKPQNKNFHLV